jgi:type VI secretion system protein ImpA
MLMDAERLLEPCVEVPPCGPSLEYDADFLKLEELATGTPERQYGDVVIAAEPPDWGEVLESATALLIRSKDMRVVSLFARAALNTGRVSGLKDALSLASALVDRYWPDLHPLLTYDGVADSVMRSNAIAALSATDGILSDLRSMTLLQHRGVTVSIRQAESLLLPGENAAPENLSREQLSSFMTEILREDAHAFEAIEGVNKSALAIHATCVAHLGVQQAPDLKSLLNLLGALTVCIEGCRKQLAAYDLSESNSSDQSLIGDSVASGGVRLRSGNVIQSRADASLTLDAVCKYFEHHEPASPVPILLRRAQRLIGMSFVDIIRDMAPDSMSRIDIISGENTT